MHECLQAGLACNDARIVEDGGRWLPVGDPTEAALAVAARKAGLSHGDVPERVDALPFSSERLFMATRHANDVVYVKGAVERVSAILLACSFGAFRWQLASGATLEVARTVAVNVFVGAQIAYLVNCRSLEKWRPSTGPNRWLWVGVALTVGLQLLLTYVPFMNTLFHTAPLGWQPWLVVFMLSAAAYVVVELEKWRQRHGKAADGQAGA